ncbi:MAG TPA: hypothetical protein VLU95_02875 [Candidatus Acidoferrum sp.]|nr:hypothetical protein [Candidatus Acidoferrum sp.]
MADASIFTHLVLAFAVGSLWVSIITIIAEKKGSVIGGILGGLPSTSAFSFFFIGINQSSNAAVQATTVFPLAFGVTSAYLFFYAFFAQKGFVRGITFSLIFWFATSALIVASGLSDFAFSLIGGTVISVLVYFFFKKLKLQNMKGEEKVYRFYEIILRGIGAGSLVLLSVLLSQIGGPVLGGIAAAFPAVFTSTFVILNRSRGTEFSRAMTKPLVFSGILTIIPFSVAVRYLFPSLGIWVGTLVSYVLVIPLAILSYYAAQH